MAVDGYRIGEVAEETGFPPSTLRFYEDEALIPAPDRTAAGQRVYSEALVDRLRFMARAKRLGLSLEEIAELANAWANQPCSITHEQLVGMLEAKLAQIHEEIVELRGFAVQLESVFERVAGRPAENGRCGPDCGCAPALADEPATEPAQRRFGQLRASPPAAEHPGGRGRMATPAGLPLESD